MITAYTDKAYDYLHNTIGLSYCSKQAVEKNIAEWFNKKKRLIELLRKHPDWHEDELAIVTTVTEKRELDGRYWDYCSQLRNLVLDDDDNPIYQKLTSRIKDNFNGDVPLDFIRYFNVINNNNAAYGAIVKICFKEYISERDIDILNCITPDVKINNGLKPSRILNKFFCWFGFDTLPEYNRLFAQISDCLSVKEFKRTAILSVNPLDYLTMSNGNSWSNCSCLVPSRNFDGFEYKGKHKAGCLSYLTDDVSLVFYTLDINKLQSENLWQNPKITRQIIFYESPYVVLERIYPKSVEYSESDNNPYVINRRLIQDMIAKCEDCPNVWNDRNVIIRDNPDVFVYPDWQFYETLKYINPYLEKRGNTITIGGKSYCLHCGSQKYRTTHDIDDYMCGSLLCEDCNNEFSNYRNYYDDDNRDNEDDYDDDYDDDDYRY